jgi:hypothetical protein
MEPTQNKKITQGELVAFSLELGFVIALPLVFFVLSGKYLDSRYHTGIFLPIGIVLSLFLSVIWFIKRVKQFKQRLSK